MKKIFVLMLLSVMLLGMTSCSNKDAGKKSLSEVEKDIDQDYDEGNDDYDETEDGYTSDDTDDIDSKNNDPEVVQNKDYILFESSNNVLETFKEFGYEYITEYADGEPTKWSFEYKYLGSETIDGVDTKHYQTTTVEYGEAKTTDAWYDDTMSAVKYIDSNGEKSGADAAWGGGNLAMMTQLYCTQYQIYSSVYANGEFDDFAYEMLDNTSQIIDFGYGNSDVEFQNVKSKFGGYIFHAGTAKLKDKKFYVILKTETAEGINEGLQITKAILH